MNTRAPRVRGFTLVELLLATMLTAVVVTAVLQIFDVTLYAREQIKALAEPMSVGPRILDMIEEDLDSLWTYDIKDNHVFEGEDNVIVLADADRLHLIVAGPTSNDVVLDDESVRPAPLAEVSYLCRPNPKNPDLIELWRREDPLVDEEWKKGGRYELLSDRVRRFNITYYEELGAEAEAFDDWSIDERKGLPKRIKIELEIERRPESFNVLAGPEVEDLPQRKLSFVRHVVLSEATIESLEPGYAVLPAVPERAPEPENAQAGAAGASGRAAPGGRGAPRPPGGLPGLARPPGGLPGVPGLPGGRGGRGAGAGPLPPGLGRSFDRIIRGGARGGSSGGSRTGRGGGRR